MTQTNVRVQMQIRRDTAANWSSANPTALAGELCYETDTGKIKVGTGSDAWIVLPYSFLPLSGGSLTDHLTIHNKKELRLSDATANTAGDHYSAFKAGTQSANLTYTLPTSLPASSGQVLSCTDAGVMSWASDSTTDNTKMPLAGGTFSGSVIFDGTTTIRGDQNSAAILDLKADEGDDASDIWQVKAEGDNSFYITYWNGSAYEASLQATAEGETALKYNNLTKLATKSAGVQITGQLMNFTTGTAVLLGDNAQLDLGSSNDLKIWHNADGDSYIRNESGNLVIEANGAGDDAIKIFPGAQVELYYDGGTAKLATTSTGVKVSGAFLADDSTDSGTGNSISLGSTQDLKLYFDSSNAYCDFTDSVFYFRHNTNIKFYVQSGGAQFVGSLYADDNNKIELGSNQDFKIYYSGSNNILECRNSKELHINNAEASNLAKFIPGGAAELYFDGTSAGKKLETLETGVQITGNLKIGTAGDGIDFSAQTWTSTGNTTAELLDHYEEGTFVPTILGQTTNPTQNYSWKLGSFVRVGNIVHVSIDVKMATTGISAGTGNLLLGGLPFAKGSHSGGSPSHGCTFSCGYTVNLGSDHPTAAFIDNDSTYLWMRKTSSSSSDYCSSTAITNSSRIIAGATYITTA